MSTGGPLATVRVVELASIGPGPHAAMVLSDMGADVVRVVRPTASGEHLGGPFTLRGRRSVPADLKNDDDRAQVLSLIEHADVLIEGMRPGVAERLGVGPESALARNSRLIYARMTGWGQAGPLASTAGHDINYIALTGALHAIGSATGPVPPLNLVGDYGGGSMFLVAGILAALLERGHSGLGQVVDAAIVDGTAALIAPILELRSRGLWNDERGDNLLDGAAPFYRTYPCRDGKHVAVGALESQFYVEFLRILQIDAGSLPDRDNRANWPQIAAAIGAVLERKSREEWARLFDGSDACVTPVLTFLEAAEHPHLAERRTMRSAEAGVVAGAAPRFSRSSTAEIRPPLALSDLSVELARWI